MMRRLWLCCLLTEVAAVLFLPARAEALSFDAVGRVSADYVRHAAVQGQYLFRSTQDERAAGKLIIHDLSDPEDSDLVAAFDLGHFAYSLVASPTLVIVGCLQGLRLLDVSDPRAPVDYGTFPIGWIPTDLVLDDGKLYVADYQDGLLVVDISNPASPLLLGACEIAGYASHVAVAGQYAAVSDLYDRVHLVDVSNPAAPVEVGLWQSDSIGGIAGSGRYVLVAGGLSLHIIDISTPSSPQEVATYAFDSMARDIAVSGDRAIVWLGYPEDLVVLDISDPTRPLQQAWFTGSNGYGTALAVSGTQALLVGGEGQVLAVDLTTLEKLYEIPRLDPGVRGFRVAIAAGHAYVTAPPSQDPGPLSVIDLRNPAAPVKVATLLSEQRTAAVIARGDYLYVSVSGSPSFLVYDLSDPDDPALVAVLPVSGASQALALSGQYAYLTGADLKVIDVSDPSAPVEIGTSRGLPGLAAAVAVAGGYAYVATRAEAGLQIVDVSDPTNPRRVGGLSLPGNPTAVALSGSLAFVATGPTGVLVVEVSNPASPIEIAVLDLPATDVTVLGSYLYTDAGVIGISDLGGAAPGDNASLTSSSQAFWEGNLISVSADGLSVSQPRVTFSDTPLDHWALDAIERCAGMGIVAGYPDGNYCPGLAITRDQMAVYISRVLAGGGVNVPDGPSIASFPDVPVGHWAFKYIEYAKAQRIVQGTARGLYQPSLPVDRAHMAVFIARALVAPQGDSGLAFVPAAGQTFPDVPKGFWAYKHIEYIADPARSIVHGYGDGNYHPEYICTRDQMAVFITRAFALPM